MSFDSGVLIGLERRDTRAWAWLKRATERGEAPLVSTAAVAEAWRDGARQVTLARALATCDVRDVDLDVARAAGEALAAVPGAGPVDAIVAATAAATDAVLVTGDPEELGRLIDGHFRGARLAIL